MKIIRYDLLATREVHCHRMHIYMSNCVMLFASQSKWTSLLYASHNGHLGVVKLLLKKGANSNWRSEVNSLTNL